MPGPQPTFDPFQVLSADNLNPPMREIERLARGLFGQTTKLDRPTVTARTTTTFPMANAAWTVVPFQTADPDPDEMFNSSQPTFLTVKQSGLWKWEAQAAFASGSGERAASIYIDGATPIVTGTGYGGTTIAVNTVNLPGRPVLLDAGQQVSLWQVQTSGGQLSSSQGGGAVWLAGTWLGPRPE